MLTAKAVAYSGYVPVPRCGQHFNEPLNLVFICIFLCVSLFFPHGQEAIWRPSVSLIGE